MKARRQPWTNEDRRVPAPTPGGAYACRKCGETFEKKQKLGAHMRAVHPKRRYKKAERHLPVLASRKQFQTIDVQVQPVVHPTPMLVTCPQCRHVHTVQLAPEELLQLNRYLTK